MAATTPPTSRHSAAASGRRVTRSEPTANRRESGSGGGRVVAFRESPPRPLVQRMGPRKAKPATIARNASAAAALSANLVRGAEDLAWNGACALTGSGPRAGHHLRLELRRLRAILSLYKKLLPQRDRA